MCEDHQERDELRARFTAWMEVTVYRARLNYLKAQSRHLSTISLEDVSKDMKREIITMLFMLNMTPHEIVHKLVMSTYEAAALPQRDDTCRGMGELTTLWPTSHGRRERYFDF